MKKTHIYQAVIGILVLIFIGYAYFDNRKNQRDFKEVHNLLAENEVMQVLNDSLVSKIVFLEDNIKSKDENISELKTEIRYVLNTSLQETDFLFEEHLEEDVFEIETHTEGIETGTGFRYPFVFKESGINMRGDFILPEKILKGKIEFDPIGIDVALTQNKHGVWNTFVKTSNPRIRVTSVKSKVNPYGNKIIPRFSILTGLGCGISKEQPNIMGHIVFTYLSYGLGAYLDTRGYGISMNKVWYF